MVWIGRRRFLVRWGWLWLLRDWFRHISIFIGRGGLEGLVLSFCWLVWLGLCSLCYHYVCLALDWVLMRGSFSGLRYPRRSHLRCIRPSYLSLTVGCPGHGRRNIPMSLVLPAPSAPWKTSWGKEFSCGRGDWCPEDRGTFGHWFRWNCKTRNSTQSYIQLDIRREDQNLKDKNIKKSINETEMLGLWKYCDIVDILWASSWVDIIGGYQNRLDLIWLDSYLL